MRTARRRCAKNIRKIAIALGWAGGRTIVLITVYPLVLLVIGHSYRGRLSIEME